MNRRHLLTLVALIAVCLTIWWFILPPQLGGRTTLFITKGISMEPYIHQDDLAVLHQKKTYAVGDVIGYHAGSINAVTLHRVTVVNADGTLTTKGDNNGFLDLDHPRPSQVIGKIDHLVPGGGRYINVLTLKPVRIAGIALMAWAAYGFFRSWSADDDTTSARRARRRRYTGAVTGAIRGRSLNGLGRGSGQQWGGFSDAVAMRSGSAIGNEDAGRELPHPYLLGTAATVAVVACGILASTLMTKAPTVATGGNKIMYSMQGSWDYSADAGPNAGAVYPAGHVATGDPIYLSMVHKVDLTYSYNLTALNKFDGQGTFKLDEVVRGRSGWSKVIPLVEPTEFSGNKLTLDTSINLDQTRTIANDALRLTKMTEGDYIVSLQPSITATGEIGGHKLNDTMASDLSFTVSRQTMTVTLAPPSVAAPGDDSKATSVLTGLKPTKTDSIELPATSITSLTIAGHRLSLKSIRLTMIVLVLICVASAGAIFKRAGRPEEVDDVLGQAQQAFENMFVPVANYEPLGTTVIDVTSLEDLARLADTHDQPLMRHRTETQETYFFTNNNVAYRYTASLVGVTAEERFGAVSHEVGDHAYGGDEEAVTS